jgi:hypothetical protein
MPTPTLDLEKLKEEAKIAVDGWDSEEYADIINNTIHPHVETFIEQLVQQDGIPASGTGWQLGNIELLLVEKSPSHYVPSVRSEFFDAPASTYDVDIQNPIEAFTLGLADALTQEILEEVHPHKEDDENCGSDLDDCSRKKDHRH